MNTAWRFVVGFVLCRGALTVHGIYKGTFAQMNEKCRTRSRNPTSAAIDRFIKSPDAYLNRSNDGNILPSNR